MKNMKEADWMKLFMEQSSLSMTFWNVYVLVVGLLVGFVTQINNLEGLRYFLVTGFVFFALINWYPMYQAQISLVKIHKRMSKTSRNMFRVLPACIVAAVHFVLDVFVIGFLVAWGKYVGPTSC